MEQTHKPTDLDVLPIAECHMGGEGAAVGNPRHRQDPLRQIAHRVRRGPNVPRGAHDGDDPLHGVERADGNGVGEEVGGTTSNGHRNHVDAVVDCCVEVGEHVGVGATGESTDHDENMGLL